MCLCLRNSTLRQGQNGRQNPCRKRDRRHAGGVQVKETDNVGPNEAADEVGPDQVSGWKRRTTDSVPISGEPSQSRHWDRLNQGRISCQPRQSTPNEWRSWANQAMDYIGPDQMAD